MCGDATALALVASIAADCGDAFEVRTYRRFRPLRLDTAGLPRGLADVQPGDCVVAFSRADMSGLFSWLKPILPSTSFIFTSSAFDSGFLTMSRSGWFR